MTEILCHADSYLREFDATVVGVEVKGVVLDRTAFYPGGGGQPADAGVLSTAEGEFEVAKLSRVEGRIVHEVAGEPLPIGAAVHGIIDWE